MSKDIFVFIEQRDGELQKVGIELLGKARELADALGQKVVAILLGSNIKSKAEVLIHYGANKVILVDNKILEEYVTEPYTKAIYEIVKKYEPEIVFIWSKFNRKRFSTKTSFKNSYWLNSRLYST